MSRCRGFESRPGHICRKSEYAWVPVQALLPAVLGALVAALGAYIVALRRFSGKVGSSEASDLWKESSSLRQWTADRMKEQDQLITALRERVAGLETRNGDLVLKNTSLLRRVEECEKLSARLDELTDQLAEARQRASGQGGGSA